MKRKIFITCAILVATFFRLSAQEKIHRIEKDGFEWFKVTIDGKHGAQDANGKTIIPCEYDIINYKLEKEGKLTFFSVTKKENRESFMGVYLIDGTNLIPTTKQITYCDGILNNAGIFYTFHNKKGAGIYDANGQEVYFIKGAEQLWPEYEGGRFFYSFLRRVGARGIMDGNGKVIIKAKYKYFEKNWDDGLIKAAQGKNFKKKIVGRVSDITTTKNPLAEPTKTYLAWMESMESAGEVEKELRDESYIKEGLKWYLTTRNGKHGAQSEDGKTIVPTSYEYVSFDPFNDGFSATRGDYKALYTMDGKCIFGIDREYTSSMRAEDEFYGPYYVVYQGENAGACNADGREIISPKKGYECVQLTKAGETVYAIVEKGDMVGICDRWGKEIVPPQYQQLGLTNSGTFAYIDDSGQGHDLGIRPDGTKPSSDYASTSSSSYDAKAEKKQARRAAWAAALGTLAAGGAAVAASRVGTPGSAYTMPQVNSYGAGSVAGAIASTDRIMANAQQNIQRIGQQAMNQVQQGVNRSQRALQEQFGWATNFNAQNGRYPTQLEQDEWMRQHYPDVYQVMIQARAAQTVREGSVDSGSSNESTGEKKVSNTYKCSYCNGSGRLLQEGDVLNFGLSREKDYKCQECGNWKYKGMTHRHYDCSHCKGTGKQTFD